MSNKRIGIVGIGNCGSQVGALAEKKYDTLIDSIYINTSDADLSMVKGDIKFKIGDKDFVEGSGKNRSKMKLYLRNTIGEILQAEKFVNIIKKKKYVFIVASAAGGTGSGAAPVLMEVLKSCFTDTHFILVGVLPQIQASLMEQGNTIEFLNELYQSLGENTTYMIYDNEATADRSPTESLDLVNECIVEDIRILTGIDNFPTPYDSIDDADLESILRTPGRLLVTRLKKGLTEKVLEDTIIDDIIIKSIKQSCHCETDRNKKVVRWGIVTYFTEAVNKLYTSNLEKLREFIGTPVERFNHHAINDKNEQLNFLYLIASGMSPINDRVKRINDRIEDLKAALANDDSSRYILNGESVAYDVMEARKKEERRRDLTPINPLDIFSKFIKK
jgi:cell division GTPase FtsZ